MPLSEQEQRVLDAMERSLYETESGAPVVSWSGKPRYRSLILGILVVMMGVVALVVSVVIQQPLVGVCAFGVMLTGALITMRSPKTLKRTDHGGESQWNISPGSTKKQHFMERLNDRWDRRQER